MRNNKPEETIDVALLPLGDGRQIMFPLEALAEVQQLTPSEGPMGLDWALDWRGYQLPVTSLDSLCGLAEPDQEGLTALVVVKADKDSDSPFRAFAFTGTAAHARVSAKDLVPGKEQAGEGFVGVVSLQEQDYYLVDLAALMAA